MRCWLSAWYQGIYIAWQEYWLQADSIRKYVKMFQFLVYESTHTITYWNMAAILACVVLAGFFNINLSYTVLVTLYDRQPQKVTSTVQNGLNEKRHSSKTSTMPLNVSGRNVLIAMISKHLPANKTFFFNSVLCKYLSMIFYIYVLCSVPISEFVIFLNPYASNCIFVVYEDRLPFFFNAYDRRLLFRLSLALTVDTSLTTSTSF